ncbi:MAG: hypothetical protein ACTSPA_02535 [Promethearchaeota archaeon]
MAHYEEEEEIKKLGETIERINELNERTLDAIQDAKPYAPDAADAAEDKLETAQEKLDTAKEKLGNTWEFLHDFKERARSATEIYDEAQMSGDPKMDVKAEKARYNAERTKAKLEASIMKTLTSLDKAKNAAEKANSRANIAAIKANAAESKERGKKVRINFTLPENMKSDWKSLADDLNISISQMIRTAMESFEKNIDNMGDFGDIRIEKTNKKKKGFDNLEQRIERWGEKLEKYVKDQVGEDGKAGRAKFSEENQEKLKKRITGFIKINQAIPVDKFAQILKCSIAEAENMIYELAAEGIEGFMEKGVFRFENPVDDVISEIFKILEREE